MRIDGKVVVVTGAESGIGRCIAVECALQGASVVAVGIRRDGLAETARSIAAAGGKAMWEQADICSPEQIEAAFARAIDTFGRIDAVVANAGIAGERVAAADIDLQDWEKIIAINLTGTFNTVSAAARHLIAQGQGGSILATGSSTALRAMSGLAAYSAAKAGIHAMMQTVALELAPHKIRVNTIVPGTTATPLTLSMPGHLEAIARTLPMGEVVEPEEIARYVAFALSDALPHLTGSLLKVDSGRTIA